MPTDSYIEKAEINQALSVGATLCQARREQGLSEKDVADRLHITMHYVKALETGSYDKLPGAVFAKGYIKSYAQLLGLDSAALLAAYEADQVECQVSQGQPAAQEVRRDRNRPFVIASVVLFIGVFASLWIVSQWGDEVPVPSAQAPAEAGGNVDGDSGRAATRNTATLQPATISPAPSLPVDAILEAIADDANSAPAATAAVATEVPRVERPMAAAQQPVSPEAVAAAPVAVAPAADAQQAPAADAQQAPAADAQQAPATDAQQETVAATDQETASGERLIEVQGSGDDVLRIRFAGASWVEVNNSNRQQIYRDLRHAGDVLEITGEGPFNILLGDAPLAHMEFNGDEVDVSDDIRIDNSARLTVGL